MSGKMEKGKPNLKRYEIHVGFACSYRCVFCPSAAPGHHRQWADLVQVQTEIERARNVGAETVNFSGGEPTLHPDFPQMVRHAREVGFKHIGLVTNGFGFTDQGRLNRILDEGITKVSFSLHSNSSRIEDMITQNRGSFQRKIKALRNLVAKKEALHLPDGLFVKTVLHKKILPHLAKMAVLLRDLGVDNLGFNLIRPDHQAQTTEWVPCFRDVTPRLRELVAHNETQFVLNFAFLDIPMCKLPWLVLTNPMLRQRYIGQNFDRDITIFSPVEAGGLRRFDWKEERANVMKTHQPACARCVLKKECEGIWRGYLGIYGSAEFDVGPALMEACFVEEQSREQTGD